MDFASIEVVLVSRSHPVPYPPVTKSRARRRLLTLFLLAAVRSCKSRNFWGIQAYSGVERLIALNCVFWMRAVASSSTEDSHCLHSKNHCHGGYRNTMCSRASKREPKSLYVTPKGRMILGSAEAALSATIMRRYKGKIQMVFTSPPFPLNRKKKYGNLRGQEYVEWLASFAPAFADFLTEDGSIVIELGNAWQPGKPFMSTLALEALLAFLEKGRFNLCQQFVAYNKAKLPGPAQWVNVERIRVKDAYTNIWWMSKAEHPKADNRRVLKEYSPAMQRLLSTGRYSHGKRPSEHNIGETSFLRDNRGAIPSNVLVVSNTSTNDSYMLHCRARGVTPHPARMPKEIAEYFVNFLTEPGDTVLDPFAGSNVTGWVSETLGRRWVSIEKNRGYAISSKSRFAAAEGRCKK